MGARKADALLESIRERGAEMAGAFRAASPGPPRMRPPPAGRASGRPPQAAHPAAPRRPRIGSAGEALFAAASIHV